MKIKLYNKIAQCGLDQFPAGYEISEAAENEDGVVVLLTPTKEAKEFTLTATISDNKGNTIDCTVTYSLYECVHEKHKHLFGM